MTLCRAGFPRFRGQAEDASLHVRKSGLNHVRAAQRMPQHSPSWLRRPRHRIFTLKACHDRPNRHALPGQTTLPAGSQDLISRKTSRCILVDSAPCHALTAGQ